jgi:DHA2 family methylenomycin A resistance protein-like MFS transporter
MGIGFALILFLQQVLHYTPLQVGFLLLPATLGRLAGELAAGHLSDRWGARGLSLAGLAVFAAFSAALGQLDNQSSALQVALLLIVGNAGMSLSNAPVLHAGLRVLRDERITMGSGLLSLGRIIGGTFGVGVVGPLLALAERWTSGPPPGDPVGPLVQQGLLLSAYQLYFDLMAAVILMTIIPALLMRPRMLQKP